MHAKLVNFNSSSKVFLTHFLQILKKLMHLMAQPIYLDSLWHHKSSQLWPKHDTFYSSNYNHLHINGASTDASADASVKSFQYQVKNHALWIFFTTSQNELYQLHSKIIMYDFPRHAAAMWTISVADKSL